nr:50S ribosomal protein L3P [uncultured archaeon]
MAAPKSKLLPSANWNAISSNNTSGNLKGFICYKAGMLSAAIKDNTDKSMTKGKTKIVPVTVLSCPKLKIFSIRFYKYGKVAKEILSGNFDNELKKKVKLPKKKENLKADEIPSEGYDDIRVIVYSQVKKTGIKKKPDMTELGLTGSLEEKIKFIKGNLHKDMSIQDVLKNEKIIDVRGLTTGKGLQGPVKRFGVTLKSHKSEKGRRRPGSLGPWHPSRVTYRAAMAGQLGMFSRVTYNNKIMKIGSQEELSNEDKMKNMKNFGDVKTDYVILAGSIQGPAKRSLIMTLPLRPTKKQLKKDFELLELR